MKRWLRISSVALGVPLVLFASYWVYETSDSHTEREQYAVYSAYLSEGLKSNDHDFGDGRGLIVILDHSLKPMFASQDALPEVSSRMRRGLFCKT